MAIPTNFPPQATPPSQPAQSRTSGALVLNINAPLSNYAGDMGPGSTTAPGGNPAQGSAPAIGAGPSADTFQRRNNSPFVPNPAVSPKERLEQAYLNALNTRNDSEQARNAYLNLANQLNGESFQNNQTPQPSGQQLFPAAPPVNNGFQAPPALNAQQPSQPQADPQQFQQQLSQLQQMQQAQLQQQQQQFQQQQAQQQAQLQQLQQQLSQQQQAMQQQPTPNAYAQLDPMQQQQLAQQQMMQQMQQQQPPSPYGAMDPAMQQQMMQAQNPYVQMDPAMQQQQMMQQQGAMPQQPPAGGQQGFQTMRPEELNMLIANPQASNQKLGAILEFAARQQGNLESYELLKREASNDTSQLPPGQAQDDANLIRQAALFALGNMNRAQNAQAPTNKLYGLDVIQKILTNPRENPAVKAAAVTSLGYLDRPQDKTIQQLLNAAAKDQSQDVKNAVAQVKSGMMSAQPGAQGQPGMPGGAPMPQPGMPQAS